MTFKRVGRGSYIVTNLPAVFTRQDILDPKWPTIKEGILDNVRSCYSDVIEKVEKAVRSKH